MDDNAPIHEGRAYFYTAEHRALVKIPQDRRQPVIKYLVDRDFLIPREFSSVIKGTRVAISEYPGLIACAVLPSQAANSIRLGPETP